MDDFVVIKKQDLEQMFHDFAADAVERKFEHKEMMDINEAVAYLDLKGFGLSKSTIYKYTMSGAIPFHRFGLRKVYFRPKELDEWIQGRLSGYRHSTMTKNVASAARRKEALS